MSTFWKLFGADFGLMAMLFEISNAILLLDFAFIACIFILRNKTDFNKKFVLIICFLSVNLSLLLGVVLLANTSYTYPFLRHILTVHFNEHFSSYVSNLLMFSCSIILVFAYCLVLINYIFKAKNQFLMCFFIYIYTPLYLLSLLVSIMHLTKFSIILDFDSFFAFSGRFGNISYIKPDFIIIIWLLYTSHLSANLCYIFIMSKSINKFGLENETLLSFVQKNKVSILIFFIYVMISILVYSIFYRGA